MDKNLIMSSSVCIANTIRLLRAIFSFTDCIRSYLMRWNPQGYRDIVQLLDMSIIVRSVLKINYYIFKEFHKGGINLQTIM